jgi:hypothetical protein
MAITYMTLSKHLAAASADRMISFYKTQNGKKIDVVPVSRIETCMQCRTVYSTMKCQSQWKTPRRRALGTWSKKLWKFCLLAMI